jgi:uncharacterized protein (UPF0297 family)
MIEKKYASESEFQEDKIAQVIEEVSVALEEKGYDPINQIVGYLMSGDPGYISSYKDSRKKITQFERTKILNVLVKDFLKK